jgi:hypothetical protein
MMPPALNRVIKTCLAKDPEDRFQTAHDVKLQLQWIAEGGSQGRAGARSRSGARAASALRAVAAFAISPRRRGLHGMSGARRPSRGSRGSRSEPGGSSPWMPRASRRPVHRFQCHRHRG